MAKNLKKLVSFRFSADELALLDELAACYSGKTEAMVAALTALKSGGVKRMSKSQLLAEIERRLR